VSASEASGVEQCGQRGADAPGVVAQRRAHGAQVLRGHRLADAEVGRQHRRALVQLGGPLVEQALPDPLRQPQAVGQLGVRVAVDGLADDREAGSLHQQQQGHRHQHDAAGQAQAAGA